MKKNLELDQSQLGCILTLVVNQRKRIHDTLERGIKITDSEQSLYVTLVLIEFELQECMDEEIWLYVYENQKVRPLPKKNEQ